MTTSDFSNLPIVVSDPTPNLGLDRSALAVVSDDPPKANPALVYLAGLHTELTRTRMKSPDFWVRAISTTAPGRRSGPSTSWVS